MSEMASIYKFKVERIDGSEINFEDLKGKKIIIVNVASECGYTPQYQQLQELYEEFSEKVEIIGFPSNDFGKQEPGTNAEIDTFCKVNYGLSFPMAAKVKINEEPIYQWLTKKSLNGKLNSEVAWNFQKYLIDENGHLVTFYPSSVNPIDEKIIDWILSS